VIVSDLGELADGHLLAEPPIGGHWVTGCARRLMVADAAPVGVGVPEPLAGRLREAGWLLLEAGATPEAVAAARAASWPARAGIRDAGAVAGLGSLAPQLVVVGEAVTRPGQVAFHSRSGTWLWAGLRALGWDELRCRATNALSPRRRRWSVRDWRAFVRAVAPSEPVWLAVGEAAQRALRAAGVPAFLVAPHPSWHKRFKYGEGVAGYAARLRAAGVPEGAWSGRALPVVPVQALPEVTGALAALPVSVAYKRRSGNQGARSPGGGVEVAKLEAARRAYVTGTAPTVAAAATEAGTDVGHTQSAAREQGWHAERAAHARKVTAEAKARAVEEEAARIANARKLAWAGTQLALEDVVDRLRAGRGAPDSVDRLKRLREAGDQQALPLHPTPAQARHLAVVAQALRREPDGAGSGPLPPLDQLADEVQRLLREGLA
jgi:hypothetical protein